MACALAIAACAWLLTSSAALAAYTHPSQQVVFGPSGAPQTEDNTFGYLSAWEIQFDAKNRRLYLLRPELYDIFPGVFPPQPPRGIFAFDMSDPGAPKPLSGGFPLPIPRPNFVVNSAAHMAIDETEGNVYYIEETRGNPARNVLYSWDVEGRPRSGFPEIIEQYGQMAVDPIGYLWLIDDRDPGARLDKFDPDGSLIESFPVSIPGVFGLGALSFDPTTADMWVRGSGAAVKLTAQSDYRSHEPPIWIAGNSNGGPIAVDGQDGDLYTPNPLGEALLAYNESGDLLEQIGIGGHPGNALRPSGWYGNFRGVTVDEQTGTLYAIDTRGIGGTTEKSSVSLGSNVGVWPGLPVPRLESRPPSAVGHTSATFEGHIEPGSDPATDCRFEYISEADHKNVRVVKALHAQGGTFGIEVRGNPREIPYNASAADISAIMGPDVAVTGPTGGPWRLELSGEIAGQAASILPRYNDLTPAAAEVEVDWPAQTAPCEPSATPGAPIEAPTDVSAHVTGLTTGTTYRVRLSASNANGRNLSTDQVFTVNPTLVATGDATEVLPESVKLNGTVDPENLATTYHFQYGASSEYGRESSSGSLSVAESGEKPIAIPISGLDAGTTYHYRIVAENSNGTSVGVDRTFTTLPAVKGVVSEAATAVHRTDATLHGSLDPDGLPTTYYFQWGKTRRYGGSSAAYPGVDAGTTSPGTLHFSALASDLEPQKTYHFRIVAVNSRGTTFGNDLTFTTPPAVKGIATEAATDVGTEAATLHGSLDPDGYPTTFYFQWGKTTAYGHTSPAPPGQDVGTSAAGATPVSRVLSGVEPGTSYHFRLVGVNSFGTTIGEDRSFATPQPPSIEGFFSSHVSATGAELSARINPHGYATSYRFQYGTTTEYGSTAPVPDGALGPLNSAQTVSVSLGGLQGVTYHYRVIAESQWGTTVTEDQNFEFNPPNCPNAAVRQQTGSAYLPDCRAYELVSPGRAGGAVLTPEAPSSPLATNRLAFAGWIGIIPGAGAPPNGGYVFPVGDLYVANRTPTGWVTRYVGLSGEETLAQGGEPVRGGPSGGLYRILASQDLSELLTWNETTNPPISEIEEPRSFAPYAWSYDGSSLGRLPTNVQQIPGALQVPNEGGFLGDVEPSPDFSHYVFSAIRTAFAPGGLVEQPGSVYDNDLATGTVTVVSKTAAGADIPLDPLSSESSVQLGGSAQFLKIPAVSTDGSHILISSKAPSGIHLYMRVNDAVSYEPSLGEDGKNHGVDLAGMSADGSEVFFTTPVQMTADDHDTSIDLYRWAENGGAPTLTRISVGAEGEIGDGDECNGGWIAACGAEVVPTPRPGAGGEGLGAPRDSAMASHGGYVYFYSPEELALGARGTVGKRNLFLWHDGSVRFVATFDPNRPIEHINVSRDGTHMGLITKSQLTSYDNAEYAEMYVYDVASGKLRCVSCRPDGEPPTADVKGAQNGIFMTDAGRAFFATVEGLVPRDANGIVDVYEYVNGRPQLIGTGAGAESPSSLLEPGLVGVSADGTNAFLFTTQTLVPQDENGPFFKFYDARINGGFPFVRAAAPCAAADECHGGGSSAPPASQIGSGANLGAGGNAASVAKQRHRHKRHRHKRSRHRRAHRRAGAHKGGRR